MGVVVEETIPSEEASFPDNRGVGCDDLDNGLIVGVSSRYNISAICITYFLLSYVRQVTLFLLLCNKCTISSAV